MNFSGPFVAKFIPENIRAYLSPWIWLLGAIILPVAGSAQSFSIGFSENDPLPSFVIDTNDYQISFMLVNNHPTQVFTGPVDIMMSVGGDEPTLLSGMNVAAPVQPGDSLKLPAFSYHFNEARFTGGGGLTYDIIVWPMSAGIGQSDSLFHTLTYHHTQPNATRLEVNSLPKGFPGEVVDGQVYDLMFSVVNRDSVHTWYQPLSLGLAGDGIQTTEILTNQKLKAPVAPGDSIAVIVPSHSFDLSSGGGGLTYDIIVWPMSIGTSKADSLYQTIRIYDGAAIEMTMLPSAPLPNPVNATSSYQVECMLANRGSHPTTGPVDILVQIDTLDPVKIKSVSGPIQGQSSISISIDEFHVVDLWEDLGDGSSDLRVYAKERNQHNWLNQIHRELIVESTPTPTLSLTPSAGAVAISWTSQWDLSRYEYQIYRQASDLLSAQVQISTIPGINSPEASVTYTASDWNPANYPVTYSLIRTDLRTNVRELLSRENVHIVIDGPVQSYRMIGAPDSPVRLVVADVEGSCRGTLTWHDQIGRTLGSEQLTLSPDQPVHEVTLPLHASGVIYWTLHINGQQTTGRIIKR